MSSDGGALLLQAVDQRIGLTRRLAACFVDHRNPRRCEHSLQRLFGLALGYEDLCDHDRLRIVGQIRQRWPRVRVVVRGDAGFCRDELMAWCEAAEGVDYVFGLAQNARLKRALAQPGAGQRAGVAAVPRFPLSDAGELEPQAAGGGLGGVAAGRGVRGQPALGGDQPGAGPSRCTSSCTARAGTWRTGSRSSSRTCSRTGLRRRRGGRTSCGCTGPCSRTAWRGCGRRRRDSLWASGRDSRGATRGGQREVCSPCANSPSRTGRVPRNRSRLTQIWLREGIPERQGREINCRPASNSPLPGPVTPKSEAA